MTFTDEPSILVDGRFGVRVEDVIEVTPWAGDFSDRPLGPLEPRPPRPETELECDPVGTRLRRVGIGVGRDHLQLRQHLTRAPRLVAEVGLRPSGSSSQRKKSRSDASLRTAREGSVSRSQRRTSGVPSSVSL